MTQDLVVPLYRAISGRNDKGVSDEELASKGFFTSNVSWAQHMTKDEMMHGFGEYSRVVEGLPVFLNFEETYFFLRYSEFKHNPPAIGVIDVPISLLFGDGAQISLIRNYKDSSGDYHPTLDQIRKHLLGEEKISGESYIRGVNGIFIPEELLRPYEKFYRPNEMENGKIVFERGFKEVTLPPIDPEASRETKR